MTSLFTKEKVVNKVVLIASKDIVPNPAQPRVDFNENELKGLAESIRENGILQPISVRRNQEGNYELISGERRLKASRMVGMQTVPCIVIDTSDRQSAVFALLENIQRQDLNCFEEAKALSSLISEWNITQEEAALRLGMAQSTVANKLRLLKLPEEAAQIIAEKGLSERHARALLKLREPEAQISAALWIAEQNLNVVQAETYIESLLVQPKEPQNKRKRLIVKDIRLFLNTINKAIDTMKQAGIPAQAQKKQQDGFIEYVVKIPIHT